MPGGLFPETAPHPPSARHMPWGKPLSSAKRPGPHRPVAEPHGKHGSGCHPAPPCWRPHWPLAQPATPICWMGRHQPRGKEKNERVLPGSLGKEPKSELHNGCLESYSTHRLVLRLFKTNMTWLLTCNNWRFYIIIWSFGFIWMFGSSGNLGSLRPCRTIHQSWPSAPLDGLDPTPGSQPQESVAPVPWSSQPPALAYPSGPPATAGIYKTLVSAWGQLAMSWMALPPLPVWPAGVCTSDNWPKSVSHVAQRWDLSDYPLRPCPFSPDTTMLLRTRASQPSGRTTEVDVYGVSGTAPSQSEAAGVQS